MKVIIKYLTLPLAAVAMAAPITANADTRVECDPNTGRCVVVVCETMSNGQEICIPTTDEVVGIPS